MVKHRFTEDELRSRDDHDLLIIHITKQQDHEDDHERLMNNVILPRGERLRRVEIFCYVLFIVLALLLGAWGFPLPVPVP